MPRLAAALHPANVKHTGESAGEREVAIDLERFSYAVLFLEARIPEGSRSWRDYEFGKTLLRSLPPDEYERGIEELTAYLNL